MNNHPQLPSASPRGGRRETSPQVSIIVPAYNEAENIPLLMEKFSRMFQSSGLKGEVILVNDGSTDNTLAQAKTCQEKYGFLRVASHKVRKGITDALLTGFSDSQGEVFVFWPADLQYLPEDIPHMIEKIDQGFDIVTGWKQGNYGLKGFVSFCYNLLSRILFGIRVHDLNSVKAFRRDIFEDVTLRKDWHRYMVVLAAEKGYKIAEVRVKLYPRKYGKSKFGFWRIPIGILDLFSVKFQLSFLRKPMLFFGFLGLVLFFLGVVVAGLALYLRFIEHEGFRPLLYLVILLVLSGISFFALGFLAEAIVSLREELRDIKNKLIK
ncbi:MAG TPA: glycosyltransferase family 2 protein [candidate division Zixibacteria bacterium]